MEDLSCSHYVRHCQLVCPTCDKAYLCRLCHNEQTTDHEIDRYAVTEVVCIGCKTRQPKSAECMECSTVFGKYSCLKCSLFDDTDRGQFHCDDCGLCRVGGRDKYFHCHTCGLCLAHDIKETHKCLIEASKKPCPVCFEDLHTSRDQAHVPSCQHLIHFNCYSNMLKNGLFACPVCGKAMLDLSREWALRDEIVRNTPMPKIYKDLYVQVLCKDCNKECITLFHFEGLKCKPCGSYNTTRAGGSALRRKVERGNAGPAEIGESSSNSGEGGGAVTVEELSLYEPVDLAALEDDDESDEWESADDDDGNDDHNEGDDTTDDSAVGIEDNDSADDDVEANENAQ